jgi:hypothetical protein
MQLKFNQHENKNQKISKTEIETEKKYCNFQMFW